MGPGADYARERFDLLAPYAPRLVVDWLADTPQLRHRAIAGTAVFADISGFTALTERLAARGKAGAEEMGDVLNSTFEALLTAAYDFGANLVKWGGDAVLLLFDGEGHAHRAARAAWEMQAVMRRIGRITTSHGSVRLGMSIGIHTGEFDFMLVGSRYRELIVTGPGTTATARMEKIADRGEIVVSAAAKAALPAECCGDASAEGWLLTKPPAVDAMPNRARKRSSVDIGQAFCTPLRDHLESGVVDHEHRGVTVAFIEFSGTDELLAEHGVEALVDAVEYVVDAVQEAVAEGGVTILATDLCEDGGKIFVASGIPHAAGDAETRLLSAVRRVVHPGGRLALRAGVNHGRVFAGDYGPFYRRTYSVVGDCVNLAARLMAKAHYGQVIAMPSVVERSRTRYETEPLEPFAVKGKADLVDAVLVGDPTRAAAPVAANRLPLIGRDEQLATLLAAGEAAGSGTGRIVDLIGAPGMGKSRLIEEFVDRSPARVLWADGEIYASTTPYQPMQRLLRHTLGLPDDVEDATLAAVLHELTAGVAPDLLPSLPLIGVVAGVDLPMTDEVASLDPEVRKARLEAVTSDLLGRLLTMPIVMVFNDLYLMDDATVDFLKRLATDVADRPWVIVATRRPESSSPFAAGDPVTRVRLEALSTAASAELLMSANGATQLPPHRLRQLAERAAGNPLFLRELIAGALSGADLDHLPDTVEGVIAARIDRLSTDRRRWLRAAAVLGMTVDTELLGEVLAADGPDTQVDIAAEMAEFLVAGVDGQWRFSHHLVRATAYEGLPYRRRTELHARTADILETRAGDRAEAYADLLSTHCFHGERFGRAWRYSRIAATTARNHYALTDAAECFERALTASTRIEDVQSAEVADVCEDLAAVYVDLGERTKADTILAQGRRRARGDVIRLARLRLKTAIHREQAGHYTEALRWAGRGRSLLGDRDDAEALSLRSQLADLRATVRRRQGKYARAIVWADQAVEDARRAGDVQTEARALVEGQYAAALLGQRWDDETFRYCVEVYERLGDLRGLARAYSYYGACAYYAGRWDDAVRLFGKSESAYWKTGREYDAAINAANRAEVLIAQGHLEEVEEILDAAIKVWLATDSTSPMAFGLMLQGRAALAAGDLREALTHLTEARMLCVQLGQDDEVASIEGTIALCQLRRGNPGGGLETVEAALDRTAAAGASTPLLLRVKGECLVALGYRDDGYAALRESLADARRREARHEIAESLEALLRLSAPGTAAERTEWSAERQTLVGLLGVVEQADQATAT